MSLILEALRKSEAERRRGQAPQLFDPPTTPAPVGAASPARTLWWALPVVLSLVLLVLWRFTAVSRDATVATGPAPGADAAQTVPAPQRTPPLAVDAGAMPPAPGTAGPAAPAAGASPTSTPYASVPAPVIGPAAMPQPPAVAPAARPAEPAPRRTIDPVARTAPAPEPSQAAPVASAAPPARPAAVAPPPATSPPMTDSRLARSEPARVRPAPALPPAQALPPAVAPVPAPSAGAGSEPLRMADLTPAERRALPPLRMSMHLWSPDAAQRFVILDGTRVGEGDRIGDAVVAEITGDGAVLSWGGRRVKVPVR